MKIILALIGCFAATQASAQQSACANPITQLQINNCAHEMWMAADGDLNADYKYARFFLKAVDSDLPIDSQGGAKALLLAQRAWIIYRDQSCIAESAIYTGGSLRPLIVLGCKERLTRARSEDLRRIFEEN